MKILHVNAGDSHGGAARAAHRLLVAQRRAGMDSHLLVLHRGDEAPYVHAPIGRSARLLQRVKRGLSEALLRQQQSPSNPVVHSANVFDSGLGTWINRSDFDIVNLHWVGFETLSIAEIGRIRQPLVWTMHDMWPFCGAEHYDDLEHPGRYLRGYTPATRHVRDSGPDIDAWVWRRKQRAWAGRRFHLVSPSHWLAECARNSQLMREQPCVVIPNCVDTDIFKPVDRQQARHILNLDPDKRYVLFGAIASTRDRRKGFHLLEPALRKLAQQPALAGNTALLIFGASEPAAGTDFGLPAHYMGQLHDDVGLALLYAAADVFVAPSMQDNLPNTVVEATACGIPCVAFALGGMTDLVEDGVTGRLVPPFDIAAFAAAMVQLLVAPLPRDAIRHRALGKHHGHTVAQAYAELYGTL